MQETIPAIEERMTRLATIIVKNKIRQLAPMITGIDSAAYFEGSKSSIKRPSEDREETISEHATGQASLNVELLLYGTLGEIIDRFTPIAEQLAAHHEKMLFRTLMASTEKTGNKVDTKGRPLDIDVFIEVIEKIQIDFDEHGNPIMPTMVCGPEMFEKTRALKDASDTDEHKKRLDDLISRKRREWLDREADRTLVG